MVVFHSYVSLPEGIWLWLTMAQNATLVSLKIVDPSSCSDPKTKVSRVPRKTVPGDMHRSSASASCRRVKPMQHGRHLQSNWHLPSSKPMLIYGDPQFPWMIALVRVRRFYFFLFLRKPSVHSFVWHPNGNLQRAWWFQIQSRNHILVGMGHFDEDMMDTANEDTLFMSGYSSREAMHMVMKPDKIRTWKYGWWLQTQYPLGS